MQLFRKLAHSSAKKDLSAIWFVMLHTYGRDVATEKIVFREQRAHHPAISAAEPNLSRTVL